MKASSLAPRRANSKLRISLLVACYNEEKSLEKSVYSCLQQTRKFDELIYVDDSSTDQSPEILKKFADKGKIIAVRTPKNTGNKSSAQQYGLQFITGDIFVTTDADTLLDKQFVREIEKSFQSSDASAVAGYVRSLPYNWLTLCRAFEYSIGQNIHKLAEAYMQNIFVIPGAASAFRTDVFRSCITFDHDTITEDLDFTYKLHERQFKIVYNGNAITYTQDPSELKSYVNQTRRWFGGGWQNLLKHFQQIPESKARSFELALLYGEGMIFSFLFLAMPLINLFWFVSVFLVNYFLVTFLFAIWAAYKERRPTILLVPLIYVVLMYINAYIYLEQFYREVILREKNLVWFKPERYDLTSLNSKIL